MKGSEHATTGAATGTVTTALAGAVGLLPGLWFAGVVAGSILPDGDHVSASIARMWGPVSGGICRAFTRLVGGHRGLTHRPVLGPVLVVAVLALASTRAWSNGAAWAFLTGVFLTAGARVLEARLHWVVNLTVSTIVGVAAAVYGWPVIAVVAPVVIGVLVHLFGDRYRPESRQARTLLAVSYLAVVAWLAWPRLGPHIAATLTP